MRCGCSGQQKREQKAGHVGVPLVVQRLFSRQDAAHLQADIRHDKQAGVRKVQVATLQRMRSRSAGAGLQRVG
jgi:hypothetical protein